MPAIASLYIRHVLGFDVLSRRVSGLAVLAGLGAAVVYGRSGLALSHYDAKAHLVVARRILDSITPGWEQIGAVWLPLPHLLNMLPVQIDLFYRTGASAIALSIGALATIAALEEHAEVRARFRILHEAARSIANVFTLGRQPPPLNCALNPSGA